MVINPYESPLGTEYTNDFWAGVYTVFEIIGGVCLFLVFSPITIPLLFLICMIWLADELKWRLIGEPRYKAERAAMEKRLADNAN
jgi:hypothetical protein